MNLIFLLSLLTLNAHSAWFQPPKLVNIKHNGLDRAYLVYVPDSYKGDKPVPLLLVFHGDGDNMYIQAKDKFYRQISSAEKYGHIAVFPNGDKKEDASWNAGKCCRTAIVSQIDDVGFVKEVIKDVKSKYKIDSDKVFSTGMSSGGMLSIRLACEISDTIAGVASVAGTDNTIECKPTRPVSVMLIHAKDDDLCYYNGTPGPWVSVPDTLEKWKKHNGCTGSMKTVFKVPGAHCEEYSNCKAGSRVRLCLTDTGKHSWPEGDKVPGQNASEAISASDVMWDFFQSIPTTSTSK